MLGARWPPSMPLWQASTKTASKATREDGNVPVECATAGNCGDTVTPATSRAGTGDASRCDKCTRGNIVEDSNNMSNGINHKGRSYGFCANKRHPPDPSKCGHHELNSEAHPLADRPTHHSLPSHAHSPDPTREGVTAAAEALAKLLSLRASTGETAVFNPFAGAPSPSHERETTQARVCAEHGVGADSSVLACFSSRHVCEGL